MTKTAIIFVLLLTAGCSKKSSDTQPVIPPSQTFRLSSATVNGKPAGSVYYDINTSPIIRFFFTAAIDHRSVNGALSFKDNTGTAIPFTPSFENNDSTLVVRPQSGLKHLTPYALQLSTALLAQNKSGLQTGDTVGFLTSLDSTDKFPRLSDSALLTLVQRQTFAYFWDYGHPVSGLARERTSSGDVVTTGGSGFGIMSILVGAYRNFITRQEALQRISTIVRFLSDTSKVSRYHGAFPHWLNGATGATVPFSNQDNGGDIVETAYMMQGLLCARQYFNSTIDVGEVSLRDSINRLWQAVDWNWYRQNGQNALYWNWSPNYAWAINVKVSGWNEALITHVLAAAAPVDPIPRSVYDEGWARHGAIVNGRSFYGIPLPLGPDFGGPLFFAHYSFLGIDPNGLSDAYANYWTQDTAHTRINYLSCVLNPKGYYGYSNSCWGLTASDEQNGYSAHSPSNDNGTITPTAAISSIPYTPVESMRAIRFFYYALGDKCWGKYGFTDAFNLGKLWFDSDCLAIDQGPQVIMIENYRSGLLWKLFMSCPEIKTGLKNLGFQGPGL